MLICLSRCPRNAGLSDLGIKTNFIGQHNSCRANKAQQVPEVNIPADDGALWKRGRNAEYVYDIFICI